MSSEQVDSKSISLNVWLDAYNDALEVIKYTLATNHAYLGGRPLFRVPKKYLFKFLDENDRFLIVSASIYPPGDIIIMLC